jgi:hypothetical protein
MRVLIRKAGLVILNVPAHIWPATRFSTNTLLEELFASLRMPDLIAQVGRVLRHIQNASAKRLKKYGRA